MKPAVTAFIALMCGAASAIAADPAPNLDFFEVALCGKEMTQNPEASADAAMEALDKLGEPENIDGMRVYHLPRPISRDGYTTQSAGVVAAPSTFVIGVLFDGKIADALAKRYDLAPSSDLPNAYFRRIPWSQRVRGESGANTLLVLSDDTPGTNQTFMGCALDEGDIK